jgi:hypothetical protein
VEGDFGRLNLYLWSRQCGFSGAQLPYKSCPEKLCDRPLEEGSVTVSETGAGQGSVISPLLANVYLHYVFDLWAAHWRRREATGTMIITRYAETW